MKKQLVQVFLCLLLLLLMPTSSFAEKPTYGAKAALMDSKISLAKALTYALEDEYLAHARYDKAIEKFGDIQPFTQMKVEEQYHIQALLPFFKKYNIDAQSDFSKEYANVPKSLKEAFREGVKGEIDNVAMYDKLVSIKEFPEDILSVFNQLRTASRNHLKTFRRGLQQ